MPLAVSMSMRFFFAPCIVHFAICACKQGEKSQAHTMSIRIFDASLLLIVRPCVSGGLRECICVCLVFDLCVNKYLFLFLYCSSLGLLSSIRMNERKKIRFSIANALKRDEIHE